MSRYIDAEKLKAEIRKAAIHKSDIPGNWWNGRPRDLSAEEMCKIDYVEEIGYFETDYCNVGKSIYKRVKDEWERRQNTT